MAGFVLTFGPKSALCCLKRPRSATRQPPAPFLRRCNAWMDLPASDERQMCAGHSGCSSQFFAPGPFCSPHALAACRRPARPRCRSPSRTALPPRSAAAAAPCAPPYGRSKLRRRPSEPPVGVRCEMPDCAAVHPPTPPCHGISPPAAAPATLLAPMIAQLWRLSPAPGGRRGGAEQRHRRSVLAGAAGRNFSLSLFSTPTDAEKTKFVFSERRSQTRNSYSGTAELWDDPRSGRASPAWPLAGARWHTVASWPMARMHGQPATAGGHRSGGLGACALGAAIR